MQTKTLATFKRDIEPGDAVLCLEIKEAQYTPNGLTPLMPVPLKPAMQKLRYVVKVNTTGFYLKSVDDTSKNGSFCNWPQSAKLLDYNNNTFTITEVHPSGYIWQTRTYQLIK